MASSKPSRTEIQPGIWLDSRRALFIEALGVLVVADIHWGFATSHRLAGNLLPLWGDEEIAATLLQLVETFHPGEMIWLGDSLHRVAGRHAAEAFLRETGHRPLRIAIVTGNHDRRWPVESAHSLQRGNFYFHHGDLPSRDLAPGVREVIGHFHPAVGLRDGAGTRLRLPALVASERRLILPAFSPWAAGAAWNERREPGEKIWAIAPSRIFAVRFPDSSAPAASP